MKLAAILAISVALAACAAGSDYQRPPVSASAAAPFLTADGAATQPLAPVPADWWKLYDDPVLDRLVADALAANTDVRAAVARVAQARATLRGTRTDRLPNVTAGGGGTYGRDPQVQDDASFQASADLGVAYEVDLFGRVGRGVEAAKADLDASSFDAEAVRVMVVAETTRAYADAANIAQQVRVAERTVALLEKSLTITHRREEIGETSKLETARMAALVEQRRAEVPALVAQRDAALFRLALLTGRAPADLPPDAGARNIPLTLKQPIPVGDGAALIARRPDVRAAERRLAASTARIGVATAELYPRITLGASTGVAGGVGSFLSNPVAWLVGPLISWSFRDHAAARARVQGAEAQTAESLAQFDGSVLKALSETETALSAYQNALRRQQRLVAARDQAATASRIVAAQQREGQVDALVLLDAQRSFADAEAQLAAADTDVSQRQISLFQTLGGGWR
jgi:NodT family efflux transporter outer membrane factor (OMF) lipoprotein